ncbi:Pyridoxamine 5'-phosphate oxidase-related, FMN-binding [Serinicoccus hydrothermalis]|uniref:Pyridoxamine 5'-phosphate oxidase-related, FMN-binding n=1 Tax=Serinicoccus hydrothermalis TaxID=1758689 RepID=A0A1B1NDC4_9MICO|nr:pyridoxamine 5'-phosphate oxidase family protein [Serinicoccus hydrothermalis]ANS79439.1 Pyridoxamine 5'-phosphate oxidase-related, FMN-binding [Serinicoccus hydrothermalis]
MTDLSTPTRKPERYTDERARLDELLDGVPVGVLSTVHEGLPWSVPMLVARDGDRVLLHGSTGAGALRHLRVGAPITLTVMALDGLVVAESAFDSSANYRSAVLRGTAVELAGDEAAAALERLTDRLLPGRTDEIRGSTRRELAATTCLVLPIEEGSWLFKERTGGTDPSTDPEVWSGVVPLRLVAGMPEPTAGVTAPTPGSVQAVGEAYPGFPEEVSAPPR